MWATPPHVGSPDPIEWTPRSPPPHTMSPTQWWGPVAAKAQSGAEHSSRRQLLLDFFQPPISKAYFEGLTVKVILGATKYLGMSEAIVVKALAKTFRTHWERSLREHLEALLKEAFEA